MKTLVEVLIEMREWDSVASREWADVLEAAMTQPVAEVINVGGCWELQVLGSIDHGMKLYALPPDAAGEIERLTKGWGVSVEAMQGALSSRDAEIERLTDILRGIEVYATDTLSKPMGAPDDRKWYRDGVVEIVKRVREVNRD